MAVVSDTTVHTAPSYGESYHNLSHVTLLVLRTEPMKTDSVAGYLYHASDTALKEDNSMKLYLEDTGGPIVTILPTLLCAPSQNCGSCA